MSFNYICEVQRFFTFLLVFLFFQNIIDAQVLSKTYFEGHLSQIEHDNGHLMIIGQTNSKLKVLRTNMDGEVVWSKISELNEGARDIELSKIQHNAIVTPRYLVSFSTVAPIAYFVLDTSAGNSNFGRLSINGNGQKGQSMGHTLLQGDSMIVNVGTNLSSPRRRGFISFRGIYNGWGLSGDTYVSIDNIAASVSFRDVESQGDLLYLCGHTFSQSKQRALLYKYDTQFNRLTRKVGYSYTADTVIANIDTLSNLLFNSVQRAGNSVFINGHTNGLLATDFSANVNPNVKHKYLVVGKLDTASMDVAASILYSGSGKNMIRSVVTHVNDSCYYAALSEEYDNVSSSSRALIVKVENNTVQFVKQIHSKDQIEINDIFIIGGAIIVVGKNGVASYLCKITNPSDNSLLCQVSDTSSINLVQNIFLKKVPDGIPTTLESTTGSNKLFVPDTVRSKNYCASPNGVSNASKADILIYPNPFSNYFTIAVPMELATIELYDLQGKTVAFNLMNSHQIKNRKLYTVNLDVSSRLLICKIRFAGGNTVVQKLFTNN